MDRFNSSPDSVKEIIRLLIDTSIEIIQLNHRAEKILESCGTITNGQIYVESQMEKREN